MTIETLHIAFGPEHQNQIVAILGAHQRECGVIDAMPYDRYPVTVYRTADGRAVEVASRTGDSYVRIFPSSDDYFAAKNAARGFEIDPETGRAFNNPACAATVEGL